MTQDNVSIYLQPVSTLIINTPMEADHCVCSKHSTLPLSEKTLNFVEVDLMDNGSVNLKVNRYMCCADGCDYVCASLSLSVVSSYTVCVCVSVNVISVCLF